MESQVFMEGMKLLLNVLRTGAILSGTEVQKHVNLVETQEFSLRAARIRNCSVRHLSVVLVTW